MLQIFKCPTPAHKYQTLIESLKNPRSCLIVSDLQSKFYWQSQIENPVFRASEFWRILLKKTQPQLQIVSEEIFSIRLQKTLDQMPETAFSELGIKKIKLKTFRNYFFELFPLFSHPDSDEIMQNWFNEKKQTQGVNWEPIYRLCQNIWKPLQNENILPEKCISSFLLSTIGYEFIWKSPLLFDLGGNLASTEAELILTLSQQLPVQVIEPASEGFADFYWLGWPYQQLKTRSYKEMPQPTNSAPTPMATTTQNKNYLRFKSPLSEVKMATQKIQDWLRAGIPAKQIFITAPQIESYWTALKWHFDEAKIPYHKELRIPLVDLLGFKKLVGNLKCIFLQSQDKADLESALYINEGFAPLKYADFSFLFSQMFSNKDYYRHPKVVEKLAWQNPDLLMTASDFLNFMAHLQELDFQTSTFFEDLRAELIQNIPEDFKVEIRYWIYYLEQILFKKEKRLTEGQDEITADAAIQIIPLPASYTFNDHYGIFLGLDETSLRSAASLISGADVMSLLYKTGHLLNHPDRNYIEFLLQWSHGQSLENVYSFSETNWQSEELTPSIFWLIGYHEQQAELQFLLPKKDFGSETGFTAKVSRNRPEEIEPHSINQNHLFKSTKGLNISEIFNSLSPSGLEKLNDCAFKYYVERFLGLTEDRCIDLDPSPMTLGSLYHKLCELLTIEPMVFELNETQWQKIIETTLSFSTKNELLEFQRFEIERQLKDWGKEFLLYEKNWRETHPESRVFRRELKISGQIDEIKFIGKIDRIDWNLNDQYSIVDYKSTVTHLTGPNSWIKNNQLQLLCYIYAAEKGWLEGSARIPITGAYYLSLKNFDKKGFTLNDTKPSFLSAISSRSELSFDTKTELMTEFESLLHQSIAKLKSGDISPKPRDENLCQECEWKQLCRAPHLNM